MRERFGVEVATDCAVIDYEMNGVVRTFPMTIMGERDAWDCAECCNVREWSLYVDDPCWMEAM